MPASETPRRRPSPPVFALGSGALCLDFANTWGDRGRPERDRLRGYGALLAFARQARILAAAEGARLERRAARRPLDAEAAFGRARELREAIFRAFAALAVGELPEAADVASVNRELPAALARLRIAPAADGFAWRWADPGADLEAPLAPVVRSAAELLVSEDAGRIRQCASERCTWLFVDSSRNHARRWCDMKTCGNRAKARRHYRRRHG